MVERVKKKFGQGILKKLLVQEINEIVWSSFVKDSFVRGRWKDKFSLILDPEFSWELRKVAYYVFVYM